MSAPDSDKGKKPLSYPLRLNREPNQDSSENRKSLAWLESVSENKSRLT